MAKAKKNFLNDWEGAFNQVTQTAPIPKPTEDGEAQGINNSDSDSNSNPNSDSNLNANTNQDSNSDSIQTSEMGETTQKPTIEDVEKVKEEDKATPVSDLRKEIGAISGSSTPTSEMNIAIDVTQVIETKEGVNPDQGLDKDLVNNLDFNVNSNSDSDYKSDSNSNVNAGASHEVDVSVETAPIKEDEARIPEKVIEPANPSSILNQDLDTNSDSNSDYKVNQDSDSKFKAKSGPKSLARERKTRHFNALLKPSIHENFKKAAKNAGISINDAVEVAMEMFIQEYQS